MQIVDPCHTGMAGNTAPVHCAPVATPQTQDRSQRLSPGSSPADRSRRAASLLMRFFGWYHHRRRLARERRLLASFDDHMLRDIGLSRADAEQEISKGFWRD